MIRIMYRDVKGAQQPTEITDIVETLRVSTSIYGSAGRAELSIIGDGASFAFGSCLSVFEGDIEVFRGYLFSVSMTDTSRFTATFYDQTRYLRNTDVLVYNGITASDLFKKVCEAAELKVGVIDKSSYKLPATVSEGKSYWDMMTEAIDYVAAYEKKIFIIRDVAGELEFRDIENLRTDFTVDDEGISMGFDYTVGIDQDSFNRVKIGFEGSSAREWGLVQDIDTVREWGVMQFYQLLRFALDKTELDTRCKQQLALKDRPTRELRLTCFGDWRISAGSGVGVSIKSVQAFNGMNHFYVKSCEHQVSNDLHTMDLTLAIDDFGA